MVALATEPLLECRGIGMRFGGETALADVDFSLLPGEVHGLVGSNGAGKSTLMKILAGALPDHSGATFIHGKQIELSDPRTSLEHGISMVYQELSGIGQLSVAENLFLGRQPTGALGRVRWRSMYHQAGDYLAELGIHIDVRRRLDRFPLVIRQMVEIARGIHSGARILILDEPTSSLSPPETRRLFELIRALQHRGVAIVFISHFLEDVLEICDRVTVLRDGRLCQTTPAAVVDKHVLIHTMLGHDLRTKEAGYETAVQLPPRVASTPILQTRALSLQGAFAPISFEIAPGECLGLYGFVGAGHQELAHVVAGSRHSTSGAILLDGTPLPKGNVHDAVKRGVVLVAADRSQTVIRSELIYKNLTLAHLRSAVGNWLWPGHEIRVATPVLGAVGCQPPLPRLKAGSLSGGNQQKVVMGKWLLGPIRVLILEEPTRGMDVGAKEEIMRLVADLKSKGVGILLASTEPELIAAHCDRVLVFRRGVVTSELVDTTVDKGELVRHA